MTDAPAGPSTPYGTELRRVSPLPWVCSGIAAVFAICSVAVARSETPGIPRWGQLAAAAFLAVFMVVLPAVCAVVLLRRRLFLSADALHVTSGGRLVATLRWADLESVRADPGNPARMVREAQVLLAGRPSAGSRAGRHSRVLVGARTYQGFDALVAALAEEVRRRPDLLPSPAHRELFDGLVQRFVTAPQSRV